MLRRAGLFSVFLLVALPGALPAWADSPPAGETTVILAPTYDPTISISVTCDNQTTYNTMGQQSNMDFLLNRVDDFCKDQEKDGFGDDSRPKDCRDVVISDTADKKPTESLRVCKQGNGKWNPSK